MKKFIIPSLVLGVALAFVGTVALASRDSGGNYTLPGSVNPVISGTTITSTWANTTLNDLKTEVTNSLDRNGRGAMLAPLKLYSGSVSSPGQQWGSESNSGFYRAGSHDIRYSMNGADLLSLGVGTLSLTGTATVTGSANVGSATACTGPTCELDVYQAIKPIVPAPGVANRPQGNDLRLQSRGAANLSLQQWSLSMTASTTVATGSHTITVASATACPSTYTLSAECVSLTGTTAQLCPPAGGCSLVIDPDTANEETITSANWSVAGASTITATFAKVHTQPYTVRQQGAVNLDARWVGVNTGDAANRPITLLDRSGSMVMSLPNDIAGTFPYSAAKVGAVLTGANGASSDITWRNATTTSCIKGQNASSGTTIYQLCEGANSAKILLGNPTNNSIRIDALNTQGSIYGGGTNATLIAYTNQGGVGSQGIFDVRNNAGDNTSYFKVNTTGTPSTTIATSTTNMTASTETVLLQSTGNNPAYMVVKAGSTVDQDKAIQFQDKSGNQVGMIVNYGGSTRLTMETAPGAIVFSGAPNGDVTLNNDQNNVTRFTGSIRLRSDPTALIWTCDVNHIGWIYYEENGGFGLDDAVRICVQRAGGAFQLRTVSLF